METYQEYIDRMQVEMCADMDKLKRVVRAAEEALPECWDTPRAERILREALEALPEHLRDA